MWSVWGRPHVNVYKDSEQQGNLGVPGIIGMNILADLMAHKEVTKLNLHRVSGEDACVKMVLANTQRETNNIAPTGGLGNVKVAGCKKVTIRPYTWVIVQGCCRTLVKSHCQAYWSPQHG